MQMLLLFLVRHIHILSGEPGLIGASMTGEEPGDVKASKR